MSSSSDSFLGSSVSREPEWEIDSPFLNEALFVDEESEAEEAWETRLINLQSPFLDTFEDGYNAYVESNIEDYEEFSDEELDEAEFDQEEELEDKELLYESQEEFEDEDFADSITDEFEAEESLDRSDLGVSAKQVTSYDWAFQGKQGEQFKKLVEWAAKEVDINPGLLGVVAIAEARRSNYFKRGVVSSYDVGTDDFYEKRKDIERKIPAYTKVLWNQTKVVEHNNDAKEPRKVKTIFFSDGRNALLAVAVYLKHGEEVLRGEAKTKGKDFDALPIETRFALVRIAFHAGHGRARRNLEEVLAGKDILIRKPQNKAGPQRKATIHTARAMYISGKFFGISTRVKFQPEFEEPEEFFDELYEEEFDEEESEVESDSEFFSETDEEIDTEMEEERFTDFLGEYEREESDDEINTYSHFASEISTTLPKNLKLAEHFHVTKSILGISFPIRLEPKNMNPGYIDPLNDKLVVDRSPDGLQTLLENCLKTDKYNKYLKKIGIVLVDLTGDKLFKPDFAGWRSTVSTYGASVPKICALYAAYQLRFDLNHLAVKNSISKKVDLIKTAKNSWQSVGFFSMPILDKLFDFKERSTSVSVEFNPDFQLLLKNIHDDNDDIANCSASKVILQLSYSYIASVISQSGLQHLTRGGLWLRGSYRCKDKKEEIRGLIDSHSDTIPYAGGHSSRWKKSPISGSAHQLTALSVATFFTLLAQRRLVDKKSSQEMFKNLEQGCSPVWDSKLWDLEKNLKTPFLENPAKCGRYWPYDHESMLVYRGKYRYVAVALTKNAPEFRFDNLITDLDRLIQIKNP